MKLKKALQTSLTAFMVGLFILAPLNSKEMVTKSQSQSFITYHLADANGWVNDKYDIDFNAQEMNRRSQNQTKSENSEKVSHDKKHAEEDKHSNHVYTYDWIKSRKKILVNILRHFTKIFVAVSYIAILLCGYMSILH